MYYIENENEKEKPNKMNSNKNNSNQDHSMYTNTQPYANHICKWYKRAPEKVRDLTISVFCLLHVSFLIFDEKMIHQPQDTYSNHSHSLECLLHTC